ncbi:MAG: hypothetical protein N3G20_00820 [Verrucomicrobiae bacterium]|nr:hypothetical protein [Verrucomicrobiae bacterium]
MEITFNCPHCQQELAVEASAAGEVIECPTCTAEITVPTPETVPSTEGVPAAESTPVAESPQAPESAPATDPTSGRVINPIASSAAAKIERHFTVPVRDTPPEILIKKPKKEEEEPAPGKKRLRIKIFRHSDCFEVGHDRYEEMITEFLNKIGEENIVSLTPLTYTHIDIATQKLMTDYALQIIYRG